MRAELQRLKRDAESGRLAVISTAKDIETPETELTLQRPTSRRLWLTATAGALVLIVGSGLALHLKTKIMIFDHNWDMIDFPDLILSDSRAAEFSAGTATHCYGGGPEAQTKLRDHFPAKDIWLTECSGGEWQKGNLLVAQASLIIETTRNWGKSVVLWNLALDQNHGPHLGGCTDCRAVVTIDHSTSPTTVIPTVDFTALAHASKFVAPGALRIDSSSSEESPIEHVAFRNADGSIVVLVLNPAATPATFNIAWQGQYATYVVHPGTVVTFQWQPKSGARR